jgi:hypothetical protein
VSLIGLLVRIFVCLGVYLLVNVCIGVHPGFPISWLHSKALSSGVLVAQCLHILVHARFFVCLLECSYWCMSSCFDLMVTDILQWILPFNLLDCKTKVDF